MHTRVISATPSEASYVLDGLHPQAHRTSLRIAEHYPALRQRSHAGLNKGEASNALRWAVFFHRQGGFCDCTFENQSYRHPG